MGRLQKILGDGVAPPSAPNGASQHAGSRLKGCLFHLCADEVGDPAPLRALLGAELTPLDEVIASAIAAEP